MKTIAPTYKDLAKALQCQGFFLVADLTKYQRVVKRKKKDRAA